MSSKNDTYIPYGRQSIDARDIAAVVKVLQSDMVTQGPLIDAFEEALCRYTGARYAVVVSSGTAALHLACLAARVNTGDEVITSPLTFVASANCAWYCGGRPVFADIERDTANIDPEQIKKRLTRKTKVLIPVHFAGRPCDMEAIHAIAQNRKIVIIEDAAHALGATYKGSKIGSCRFSDMTVFSFHPLKAITTGEGGAVMTNSKGLYEMVRMLRTHGITKDTSRFQNAPYFFDARGNTVKEYGRWYYEMQFAGFNYRITDIQAALGLSQLKKVDVFIRKRKKITELYSSALRNNRRFGVPPECAPQAQSAFHVYPLSVKSEYPRARDLLLEFLHKKRIGAQVHYMPVYLQPFYRKKGFRKGICPIAEKFFERELSIPLYPSMTAAHVRRVIQGLKEAEQNKSIWRS